MAHGTLESSDCQPVVYFYEIQGHQLTSNFALNDAGAPQLLFSASPSYEIIETSVSANADVESVDAKTGAGRELQFLPDDHNARAALAQENRGEFPSVVTSSRSPPPPSQETSQELYFGLESYASSASKTAPHLMDHIYSLNCTSTLCRCGVCEDSEKVDDDDDDDDDDDADHEEGHPRRPQSLRHHEYDRGQKVDFKCCYCDYTASRRQHVKQHLATHLKDKPFKCKMCDYSASQKQSLVAHALRFHYKRKPYKCDLCDYSAFRKQHVVVHMGKHMKEKPYKCDECNFQTSWKEYLGVHKKNLHPASKTFKPWCE